MALIPDIIRALRTSPARVPAQAAAAVAPSTNGRVGKANVGLYRRWSRGSEWVRAAINIRNNQIATADWEIVPFDPERPYSKRLQQQIRNLFSNPNPDDASFSRFSLRVNEDILVLDAGAIEKERSPDGVVRRLWPVDGGTIRVNALWDGDEREPRYFWYPDYQERARFLNRDLVYMMQNPTTYIPIGISPLETLKATMEALLFGDEYNLRQLKGAAPDGMIDLGEGAGENQVNAFRSYWLSEVAGKGAIAFVGGTKGAKFIPFRQKNTDMQFHEWLVFLVRKVAAVYGMSAQDLGLTFDINRANAEQLAENTEDRGLRPLMSTTQDYYTHEIVWDPYFGGPDNNLAFRFTRLNLKESTSKANINKSALAGVPWKTINEAREDDGRPRIDNPLYDQLIMGTSVGAVSLEEVPTAKEVADKKEAPAPADAPATPASDRAGQRER